MSTAAPDARFAIAAGQSAYYLRCRWCQEWVCDIADGDLLSYVVHEAEEHRWSCHDAKEETA